jgi:hypothetical protein
MRITSLFMSSASRYEDGKEEIEQYGPEHKVVKVPVTCILKYTNKVCCFFFRYISRKKIHNNPLRSFEWRVNNEENSVWTLEKSVLQEIQNSQTNFLTQLLSCISYWESYGNMSTGIVVLLVWYSSYEAAYPEALVSVYRKIRFHIHNIRLRSRSDTVFRYIYLIWQRCCVVNPLNAELNPICHLVALLGVPHFLHVSRMRVKSLILRLLMSYIRVCVCVCVCVCVYGAPILDVFRSHTTTHHSR